MHNSPELVEKNPALSFKPFSEEYLADPYRVFSLIREAKPVFYDEEIGYWVVSRYADVRECFRDQERFSAAITLDQLKPLAPEALQVLVDSGVVPGSALVNEDPPTHAQRRKRLMVAFTPQRIRATEPRIREFVRGYIDRIVARGSADLVRDLVWDVPALVAFHFTGIPEDEVELCKGFATSYALFNWGYPSQEEQLRLSRKLADYWRYATMHIERLSRNLGDDFISEMIRGHLEDGELFDRNYLVWMMMNFTFAGHETTTAASANMFRALLENRAQWEALVADPSLIPNAVEECLRYSSSVVAWRRTTKVPVEIDGEAIPAGANLLILNGSANHDANEFAQPETLDIRRSNANRNLSFGFGAHLCMGAPVARLEMRIMLEELTARLPHLQLVQPQDFRFSANTSFRGPSSVLVEWDASRNPEPAQAA
ncbi:cytochrome P450 [Sphingobium xenophagum]|uniref:cytochrome P450 n=1 Tax=Sphingobium xenophagum TaxID=121428 RepID=UPI00037345EF|nr:cytochrome P450 [Sphingobium xenophagum]